MTTAPNQIEFALSRDAVGFVSGNLLALFFMVKNLPQYGHVPAYYLFEHEPNGVFDVRGLGVDLPDNWTRITDAERLAFAARVYRPVERDEMMRASLEWSRRQALRLANTKTCHGPEAKP